VCFLISFLQPEVLIPKQTVSAIYSFFLALTLHPEVLKKAQSEIDAVVGSERLPTFADRPHLPYINALVLEVFRWHTVVPTGESISSIVLKGANILNTAVPHRVMQDDIHEGHFIPKGALVIPNIWYVSFQPVDRKYVTLAEGSFVMISEFTEIHLNSTRSDFFL